MRLAASARTSAAVSRVCSRISLRTKLAFFIPALLERFASSRYDYCWHIEIVPRFNALAGFELGLGSYINTVYPEDAARFLRGEVQS